MSRISRRQLLQLQYHLQWLLLLLLTLLLGWLSHHYSWQTDWSGNARHQLDPASQAIVARLDREIHIVSFVREVNRPLRETSQQLVERYRRHGAELRLDFIDPERRPDLVRELQIQYEGESVIELGERQQRLDRLDEEALTNALHRLLRSDQRRILFTTGHAERELHGGAGHDLALFAAELGERGLQTAAVDLAAGEAIDPASDLLVIAGPRRHLAEAAIGAIDAYLDAGGNLLWLHDPGPLRGLGELADRLGIGFLPGTVIDPNSRLLGLDTPGITVAADYGAHPITLGFERLVLFAQAAGMVVDAPAPWHAQPLLTSSERSWATLRDLDAAQQFDAGRDLPGPFTLLTALSRELDDGSAQRVVVSGDGDFLGNGWLYRQGNRDLGLRIADWLLHDDEFIRLQPRQSRDHNLTLSEGGWIVLGLFHLLLIPLLLVAAGVTLHIRRRRR